MSKPTLPAPTAPNASTVLPTSPSSSHSRLPATDRRSSRRRTVRNTVVALGFAGLVIATVVVLYIRTPRSVRTDLLYHKVRKEPMSLSVVERGALESADNRDVICRVRAGAKASGMTIKWVIEDGTVVKQGQLLVEIEDTALQDQLKVQKITLDTAKSGMMQAEENLKIVQSQNASEITSAEVAVDLANIDLTKYLEGDYPQAKKQVDSAIKLAQSNRDLQADRCDYTRRMVKMRYLSDAQLQAEEAKLKSLEVDLEKAIEDRRVLDKYTKDRTIKDLGNKVDAAKRDRDTKQKQSFAKEAQAETDRLTKKSIYEQELDKYEDIQEQITNCRIYSPQDGLVVYYVSEQSRFGAGSQQSIVAQGESVKEGARLMRIPDLRRMLVNTKVHEAMVSRVQGEVWRNTGFSDTLRGAIMFNVDPLTRVIAQNAMFELKERFHDLDHEKLQEGQKATVRIDAFPDRVLQGHVKSVATVASQQDWMSADVKVYQTLVSIDESVENLKPGMSAEVTVKIDGTPEDVLVLPLQAIVGGAEMGQKRKCYVRGPVGPVEREIVVGLANERVAEIRSGLEVGEEVVVNPKVLVGERAKVRSPEDNERPQGGDGAKSKGKGRGKDGKGGAPKATPGGGAPPKAPAS